MDVLEHLLRAAPARVPIADLASWRDRLATCPFARSIDRALWAGFEADRLGYAFVGGYGAAIGRLLAFAEVHDASYAWPSATTSLCLVATEKGGAHPRAIETRLARRHDGASELTLSGEKTFATLASSADELLVVASCGPDDRGRNRLEVVRVRPGAVGVTIEDRPPMPFAPEIPHAHVAFTDVVVREDDVLPGDGYALYLKPFRTIEDTHVLAGVLGHVLRAARAHGFAFEVVEGAVALAVALRDLAEREPSSAEAHVALAGLFRAARRLVSEHDREWDKADRATSERWRRDLALLVVAEGARQKRAEAARATLASRRRASDELS